MAAKLVQVIQEPARGMVFIDATRFTSTAADLSVEPDVLVILTASLRDGRVRLVPRASAPKGRYAEIEGAADLVCEVVSDSSTAKDREVLRTAYHAAGVREYWLIDVLLDVLLRRARGYVPSPVAADGFRRSPVLRRDVRLRRTKANEGLVWYQLDVR